MKPIDVNKYNSVVPIKQIAEKDIIKIPNVTGIGIGYKIIKGEETDEMAILVFVKHKGEYEPKDEIPQIIHNVKTDVIEAIFVPSGVSTTGVESSIKIDSKRYNPLIGGCSTGPAYMDGYLSAGTLGVMVRDNDTSNIFGLSNWHVFCQNLSWNQPGYDRRILQPGNSDGGKAPSDVIGNVQRAHLGQIDRSFGYDWYVDCAVCDLENRDHSNGIIRIGTLKGQRAPIVGELAKKYGRTTEFTYGSCLDTNFTVVVPYDGVGDVIFYYQYLFQSPDASMPPFTQAGDSGAVIVSSDNYAFGLNFAGNTTSNGRKYSIVNPMYMVLGAMNVSLITV